MRQTLLRALVVLSLCLAAGVAGIRDDNASYPEVQSQLEQDRDIIEVLGVSFVDTNSVSMSFEYYEDIRVILSNDQEITYANRNRVAGLVQFRDWTGQYCEAQFDAHLNLLKYTDAKIIPGTKVCFSTKDRLYDPAR